MTLTFVSFDLVKAWREILWPDPRSKLCKYGILDTRGVLGLMFWFWPTATSNREGFVELMTAGLRCMKGRSSRSSSSLRT